MQVEEDELSKARGTNNHYSNVNVSNINEKGYGRQDKKTRPYCRRLGKPMCAMKLCLQTVNNGVRWERVAWCK